MTSPIDDRFPNLAVPKVGGVLSAALDTMEATPMRRPLREFAWFFGLSLPFLAALIGTMGLRPDFNGLSLLWTAGQALIWLTCFAGTAYLALVPAHKQVVPRSRQIYQMLAANLLLLMTLGLFAGQEVAGSSVTYEANLHSILSHAKGCMLMGFVLGVVPGTIALLVFSRFIPVGGVSMGIGLGAAGGALAGTFLIFHCPVAERFHVALAHTSGIATAALFIGTASWLLRRGQ